VLGQPGHYLLHVRFQHMPALKQLLLSFNSYSFALSFLLTALSACRWSAWGQSHLAPQFYRADRLWLPRCR
jgi:hypothetical protein